MTIRGSLYSALTFASFFGVSMSARTRLRAWFAVASTIALVALLPTDLQAAAITGCPATDQRGIGRPNDEPGRTRTHAIADSNESEINEADRS